MIKIIIYRAEKEDGGGPFYHRNGIPRKDFPSLKDCIFLKNPQLYGCDSISNLKNILKDYNMDINSFIIKKYEISNLKNIISHNKNNGHIIFIPEKRGEEICQK